MIECPYCHAELEEPDECNEQDVPYEQECSECNKTFGFTVDYTKIFYEYVLPCANGEPHDWQPIKGYPPEYFANKRRCSYCSKEITVDYLTPNAERINCHLRID